ncbi:hypothetical protein WN943_013738 [Citrus x changshan-huyou]
MFSILIRLTPSKTVTSKTVEYSVVARARPMMVQAWLNSIFVFFDVISSVSGLETKITLTRTQIEIPFL